jgi:DNA-binding transcriptional LysR family regulator
MNELDTIQVFLKVAELESFSGAARQLGLPNATVSAAVRQLEQQLGTRLLQRTTRRVQMTQEGEAFTRAAAKCSMKSRPCAACSAAAPTVLSGRLRVDMSVALASELVLPRLGEFMARHPQLAIDLGTADRRVDLIREGYDCVLRAGVLLDSSLVARPLGSYRMVNCASPAIWRNTARRSGSKTWPASPDALRRPAWRQQPRPGNGSTASIPLRAGRQHADRERHRLL